MRQSLTEAFSVFVLFGATAAEQLLDSRKLFAWRKIAVNHVTGLTPREHQIMHMVLESPGRAGLRG